MLYTDAWFSLKEILYKKLQTEKQLLYEKSSFASEDIAATLEIIFLNMNHIEEKYSLDKNQGEKS